MPQWVGTSWLDIAIEECTQQPILSYIQPFKSSNRSKTTASLLTGKSQTYTEEYLGQQKAAMLRILTYTDVFLCKKANVH
jgi:hypothetical protein